jgi:hypothetical protein
MADEWRVTSMPAAARRCCGGRGRCDCYTTAGSQYIAVDHQFVFLVCGTGPTETPHIVLVPNPPAP